jgi:hypothetical protein
MNVLITIKRGIIRGAVFFDNPQMAVLSLSAFVKNMNPEEDDAVVYDENGLVANAKAFLDENDKYVEEEILVGEGLDEEAKPLYIIGNPTHPLGFMVASSDDPLGFTDPVEAVSELGQMRKEFGSHLKLYRIHSVSGPVAEKTRLQAHNADLDLEDFDYSLVEEYLC